MELPQAGDGDKVYVNSQIYYLFEIMMIFLNCFITCRYLLGEKVVLSLCTIKGTVTVY